MSLNGLRQLRKAAGITQDALAARLGVNRATISKYETGQIEPTLSQLKVISDVLGVHLFDLIGLGAELDKYETKVYSPTDANKEGTTINIREIYDSLSSEAQNEFWETIQRDHVKKTSSDLSEEALKVAKDYTGLDQPGKNVVRVVIAEEGKRVQAEKALRNVEPATISETRLIPLYYTPAAAGYTEPAAGEDFEWLEVGSDVPRKADCAIKISGDSMEPYIMDKSVVYVTREPLENGDVGIFCVDGDMLCKQYYKDDNGNVRLLSLNRERRDADRFIQRNSDTVMTYYGRVVLPRKPIVSWA